MEYIIKKAVLRYKRGSATVIHFNSIFDNNETCDLEAFRSRLKKKFNNCDTNPVISIRLTYEERQ